MDNGLSVLSLNEIQSCRSAAAMLAGVHARTRFQWPNAFVQLFTYCLFILKSIWKLFDERDFRKSLEFHLQPNLHTPIIH